MAVASVFSSTDISHYPELKKSGLLCNYQPHNLDRMVDSLSSTTTRTITTGSPPRR